VFTKTTVDRIISQLTTIVKNLEAHANSSKIEADYHARQSEIIREEALKAERIKTKLQELLN
jgi:hypothetical protein